MRTDLDHLPPAKQRELERVVQILFEEFGDAHGEATGRRRIGRILKIILYGSHARGDWVNEPHTAKGYVSDFDLLIIVNQQELTDRAAYWTKAEERLNTELAFKGTLRTPVNFIVHSLKQVNDGLAHGRYFFMDLAREGIAIYESDQSELHQPKPKKPEHALAMAREYFDDWFPSAAALKEGAEFYIGKARLKEAAFSLHQATERLCHCVLLVCSFYSPHNHNLVFLRKQAERLDSRLVDAWPRTTRKERAMFEKLKDAYVKARFSKHYRITEEELTWLGERVEELGRAVHAVCTDRIAELEAAVKNG